MGITTVSPKIRRQPMVVRESRQVPYTGQAPPTVRAHLDKAARRPPGTIWRANPSHQGLLGLLDAMYWFAAHGYQLLLPPTDTLPYDMAVDGPDGLLRVQVKTVTYRTAYGRFSVQLATRGGNQSFHTTKYFDRTSCDLLYVLTDDGSRYVIPTEHVTARTKLNLGQRMERFRVDPPAGTRPLFAPS